MDWFVVVGCLFCYFVSMRVFPACVSVWVLATHGSEKRVSDVRYPGPGITGSCEPPNVRTQYWELNLGPLE